MVNKFVKKWGIVPLLFLFMIFPLSFVLAKKGFNFGPPILFASFRMILSGTLLLGYHFLIIKKSKSFFREDWNLLFAASVIGIGFSYICANWALKHVSIAKVSIILLLVPFFSVLFEYFHNLSKFTLKKLLGLLIGLVGILPMLLYKNSTESVLNISSYEIAIIFGGASYSYGWIAVKQLIEKKRYSTVYINGLRVLIGGFMAIFASFLIEDWNGFKPAVTSWQSFLWYIVLASIIALICYSLYGFLLKHYSAATVAFSGFTEPLFAAAYASVLLNETISWIFFPSLGIIFFGLYIFYQEELGFSS